MLYGRQANWLGCLRLPPNSFARLLNVVMTTARFKQIETYIVDSL